MAGTTIGLGVITLATTVDRFEGPWAVIEHEGVIFNVPRPLLPADAREGDVVTIAISADKSTTRQRRQRIKKLEDDLFK